MSAIRARLSTNPANTICLGTLWPDNGFRIPALDSDDIPVIVIYVGARPPYVKSPDNVARILAKILTRYLRDPEAVIRAEERMRPMLDDNECRELDDAKALIREAVMLREAVQSALDSNDDAATEPLERAS